MLKNAYISISSCMKQPQLQEESTWPGWCSERYAWQKKLNQHTNPTKLQWTSKDNDIDLIQINVINKTVNEAASCWAEKHKTNTEVPKAVHPTTPWDDRATPEPSSRFTAGFNIPLTHKTFRKLRHTYGINLKTISHAFHVHIWSELTLADHFLMLCIWHFRQISIWTSEAVLIIVQTTEPACIMWEICSACLSTNALLKVSALQTQLVRQLT